MGKTPWVIAMSHYPIYLSEKRSAEDDMPLSQMPWLNAEECEYEGHDETCNPKGWKPKHNVTLTLFYEYGVDIYWAGHIHFYETFHGPLKAGKVISDGYNNPKGVVHVCSG